MKHPWDMLAKTVAKGFSRRHPFDRRRRTGFPSPALPPFDFDELAKNLAHGLSRREALRRLGGIFVGAIFAQVGLSRVAQAQSLTGAFELCDYSSVSPCLDKAYANLLDGISALLVQIDVSRFLSEFFAGLGIGSFYNAAKAIVSFNRGDYGKAAISAAKAIQKLNPTLNTVSLIATNLQQIVDIATTAFDTRTMCVEAGCIEKVCTPSGICCTAGQNCDCVSGTTLCRSTDGKLGSCCGTTDICCNGFCCPQGKTCLTALPGGAQTCEACPAGTSACFSATSKTNCCNTQTQSCCNGDCCSSGQKCCSNVCTQLGTNANCNDCGNQCMGGQACVSGQCRCPSGQDECSNDTGVFCCAPGESCIGGVCCPIGQNLCPGSTTCCPATQACCNGACCPSGQTCVGGACMSMSQGTCNPPCTDGTTCCISIGNGLPFCVDTQNGGLGETNDAGVTNCGGCGKNCLALGGSFSDWSCQNGLCCAPGTDSCQPAP